MYHTFMHAPGSGTRVIDMCIIHAFMYHTYMRQEGFNKMEPMMSDTISLMITMMIRMMIAMMMSDTIGQNMIAMMMSDDTIGQKLLDYHALSAMYLS